MRTQAESDWKTFRDKVPKLRERYLSERNPRIAAILADPKMTETERFWAAMEKMEAEAKVLCDCLDGHSRSKMQFFIFLMIRAGMMTKDDVADFSEELQDAVAHAFDPL